MAKMPSVGTVTTKVTLKNRYWRGAYHELDRLGYVEALARKRKERSKFKVARELPSREDAEREVNDKLYTSSLLDRIGEAVDGLEALFEEMDEWRGNLQGTAFESQDIGYRVEECADGLEMVKDEIEGLDIPEWLAEVQVFVHPRGLRVSCWWRFKKRRTGRSWRASEVRAILEAVTNALNEIAEAGELDGAKLDDEKANGIREIAGTCETQAQEADGFDFPGMYGG